MSSILKSDIAGIGIPIAVGALAGGLGMHLKRL